MQNASREHSAILLTFIKLAFIVKSFVLLFLSGRFRQILLYVEIGNLQERGQKFLFTVSTLGHIFLLAFVILFVIYLLTLNLRMFYWIHRLELYIYDIFFINLRLSFDSLHTGKFFRISLSVDFFPKITFVKIISETLSDSSVVIDCIDS